MAEEILAADFVDHCPFGPFSADREGVKQLFAALRVAFPDLRAEIKGQGRDAQDLHGTNDGEFMGMPPTGKKVSFDVIDILRLCDGQFVEHGKRRRRSGPDAAVGRGAGVAASGRREPAAVAE